MQATVISISKIKESPFHHGYHWGDKEGLTARSSLALFKKTVVFW